MENYSVVFTGQIIDGLDIDSVKTNISSKFKIPAEKANKMFEMGEFSIKKFATSQEAENLIKSFKTCGAICILKDLTSVPSATETSPIITPDNKNIDIAPEKNIEEAIGMSEETKNCPMCGEEILAIAKKCKHCGEMIEIQSEQLNEKFWSISKDGKFSAKDFIKEFSVKFIKAILFIIIVVAVIIGLTKIGGKSNKPVAPHSQINSTNDSSSAAAFSSTKTLPRECDTKPKFSTFSCVMQTYEMFSKDYNLVTKLMANGNYYWTPRAQGDKCFADVHAEGTIKGNSYIYNFSCENTKGY